MPDAFWRALKSMAFYCLLHLTSQLWVINKIKLRWTLFVTYTIIQSIISSEMCSLHLTHPSAHTPGAVGSRRCGARGAVGGSVPCSRGLTSVVDNSCRNRDSNPQPQITSPMLYPLEPRLPPIISKHCICTKWAYNMRKQFSTHISGFIKNKLGVNMSAPYAHSRPCAQTLGSVE